MSARQGPQVASTLVRLLLGGEAQAPAGPAEWEEFLRIAVSNVVAIRAVDRLHALGTPVPGLASGVIAAQRERATAMLEAMSRVGELCEAHHIAWCFPKGLQHLPDTGRDIDLLVEAGSAVIHGLLRRELGATPVALGLRSGLTGATEYHLPGCPAALDVQHGRLGVVGEHTRFPAELLRRCRAIEVAGRRLKVPRGEDQLVLQGMQRVYGRTGIRVADVVATIALVREPTVDWDEVIRTSMELGTGPGLSCYLSYIDRIHVQLFGSPLPCPPPGRDAIRAGWGRVRFVGDRYRFPVVAVNCRLYLKRFGFDLVRGRWASAGRLCLLPAVAAVAVGTRAGRRLRLAPAAGRSRPG